jgi:hypothetical protein
MKLTEDEKRYRRHLIRTMERESLLTMIIREHLQAKAHNKCGTPLSELYAIPTARHA